VFKICLYIIAHFGVMFEEIPPPLFSLKMLLISLLLLAFALANDLTLDDLPATAFHQIADSLNLDDLARLTTINRQTHQMRPDIYAVRFAFGRTSPYEMAMHVIRKASLIRDTDTHYFLKELRLLLNHPLMTDMQVSRLYVQSRILGNVPAHQTILSTRRVIPRAHDMMRIDEMSVRRQFGQLFNQASNWLLKHATNQCFIRPFDMRCSSIEKAPKVKELELILIDGYLDNGSGRKMTPLAHAISEGKLESVKVFIDLGANVHFGDIEGMTPYEIAVKMENLEIISLLRKHGAHRPF
jgi:hypothetical protein